VAKELSIKIKHFQINIDGDINPVKFLGISDEESVGFKSLNIQITLETDSDKDKETLFIDIVKSLSPIKNNLSNTTLINYKYN